ncbi:UrcA family protein [Phenylobacterium sp.]|uniref:UrcA family protein n=1 Tax=Phenylobacterium sp. TaxID=1871053 RepID=UPI002C4957CF|nr:UrcA family protein [Phenylobacterium sp.]HVI34310.1 UrcA family protein [Phenylobacterium sp.]
MTNFASRIAGVATLALAALPLAAIATTADARPVSVQVSDIDLNSAHGLAAFEQRAKHAAREFCRDSRGPESPLVRANCRSAVMSELHEKLPAAQLAQIRGATYAAR